MSGKTRAAMRLALIGVLSVLIGLGLYVRYAPTDIARWHRMPAVIENRDFDNGVMRVVPGKAEDLEQLHMIIVHTPRTRVLAVSPDGHMRTYVTRSRVLRFPDYITVRYRDGHIEIWSRARFGRSDLGVNAERVERWLRALAERR